MRSCRLSGGGMQHPCGQLSVVAHLMLPATQSELAQLFKETDVCSCMSQYDVAEGAVSDVV